MLRITELERNSAEITLKLEGEVVADWVAELETQCRRQLESHHRLLLDVADVTRVDRSGRHLLRGLQQENVRMINCPALFRDSLGAGHAERPGQKDAPEGSIRAPGVDGGQPQ